MKKVLLFLAFCLFSLPKSFTQELKLQQENGTQERTFELNNRTLINVAIAYTDEKVGTGVRTLKAKLCGQTATTLKVCVLEEKICLDSAGDCDLYSVMDYKRGNFVQEEIAKTDIIYIQKENFGPIRILHAISTLVASCFISILNPIISYNFESKEVNGSFWMKMHLISLGALTEGIFVLSKAEHRKYYLTDDIGGWKFK